MRDYYTSKKFNNYYSMGSEAYQLNEVYNVEEKTVKSTKTKTRKDALAKLGLVMYTLIAFSGFVVMMMMYSNIAYNQKMIKTKLATVKNIENQIDSMKAEIAETVDSQLVEKKAVEELGMVRPAAYQIVYINVPKENYTVQVAK